MPCAPWNLRGGSAFLAAERRQVMVGELLSLPILECGQSRPTSELSESDTAKECLQ
jgi:hypothetical protein